MLGWGDGPGECEPLPPPALCGSWSACGYDGDSRAPLPANDCGIESL